MLIKTLVWSTPLYIYIYSSLSSGKNLTQFYIDPLWLCALPTWRIFFFTFLMTGAPMGRWYKDSVFFSEITDKNYNKPLVNTVFIRGRHLLVIMFASICGFKSRAAFNWVRYNSLQSLPAPQKKKRCLAVIFRLWNDKVASTMLRTIGSVTVDSFSWKLEVDGFSLSSQLFLLLPYFPNDSLCSRRSESWVQREVTAVPTLPHP